MGSDRVEDKAPDADPGAHTIQLNLLGDVAVPGWLHPYVYGHLPRRL